MQLLFWICVLSGGAGLALRALLFVRDVKSTDEVFEVPETSAVAAHARQLDIGGVGAEAEVAPMRRVALFPGEPEPLLYSVPAAPSPHRLSLSAFAACATAFGVGGLLASSLGCSTPTAMAIAATVSGLTLLTVLRARSWIRG